MTTQESARALISNLFDQLAPVYDQGGVAFFQPIADRLLARVAPQPGERAVDIGAGRGAVTLPLARAVGPRGHVTAVDIAPAMLELLAASASDAGMDNVETRVGDASEVGLESGVADLVTASLVLFFSPDPATTLRQWLTLLRPDRGRIGITTFGAADEAWRETDALFQPYLPPAMRDPRTTDGEDHFATTVGLERLFTACGAATVDSVEERIEITFDSAAQWRAWTMTLGQRAMWGAVPEDEREPLFARMSDRLETARREDGLIHLGQDVRYTVATAR